MIVHKLVIRNIHVPLSVYQKKQCAYLGVKLSKLSDSPLSNNTIQESDILVR